MSFDLRIFSITRLLSMHKTIGILLGIVFILHACSEEKINNAKNDEVIKELFAKSDSAYNNENIYLSLEYCEDAMELARQGENNETVLKGLLRAQRSYGHLGLFKQALAYSENYQDEINACTDPGVHISLNGNTGILYANIGEYDKAESCYLASIEMAEKHNRPRHFTTDYINIAKLAIRKKDFDSADDYYILAEKYLQDADKKDSLSLSLFILTGRAVIDRSHQYIDSALVKLKSVLSAIKEQGIQDYPLKSWAQTEYLNCLQEKKSFQEELENADTFITSSMVNSGDLAVVSYYQHAINACDSLGLSNRKITYLEDFILLKDQLNELNLARDKKKSEAIKRHEQLALKERKEKELAVEKNKNQRLILLTLILGGFIILLITLQIWKRYKRVKSKNVGLKLKRDQLNEEIEQQNSVIASKMLQLSQQQSFILDIKTEIENKTDETGAIESQTILRRLNELSGKRNQNLWTEFETVFENLHNGFFDALLKDFPKLTPNERKLCAFIRLNLSTQEISEITGQSKHSIKIARGRLRKKLGLTHTDTSLFEFVSKF